MVIMIVTKSVETLLHSIRTCGLLVYKDDKCVFKCLEMGIREYMILEKAYLYTCVYTLYSQLACKHGGSAITIDN